MLKMSESDRRVLLGKKKYGDEEANVEQSNINNSSTTKNRKYHNRRQQERPSSRPGREDQHTSTTAGMISSDASSCGPSASSVMGVFPSRSSAFPWRIHKMLDDAQTKGFQDTVSWLQDGKGFKVHDQVRFAGTIMQIYFSQTQYKSFQRQLNIYGFQRTTTTGPGKGGYTHEFLVRGEPKRCRFMVRTKIKGASGMKKLTPTTKAPAGGTPSLRGAQQSNNGQVESRLSSRKERRTLLPAAVVAVPAERTLSTFESLCNNKNAARASSTQQSMPHMSSRTIPSIQLSLPIPLRLFPADITDEIINIFGSRGTTPDF
jgi:hypothetical protein